MTTKPRRLPLPGRSRIRRLIRDLNLLGLLATLFIVACDTDGTGPVGAEPTVVITGPNQLALECLVGMEGKFMSYESAGEFADFLWEVDGLEAVRGVNLEYTFREARDYTVTLKGLSQTESVLAFAHQTVTVLSPDDVGACLTQTRIIGRDGVLLRADQNSVTAEYTLNTAGIAPGAVDSYTWKVRKEGGQAETVASGPDAYPVEITFTEGGMHEVTVEQAAPGATLTRTLALRVYQGDPVSEAGIIAFHNGSPLGEGGRPGGKGIYFMDGETGHVMGPILTDEEGAYGTSSSGITCDARRVVFQAHVPPSPDTGDLSPYFSLWEMDHAGTGLVQLIETRDGLVQHPSISTGGNIAYIDDTRWNRARDELVLYTSWGSVIFAAGATVDTTYNGFHPTWSPDGGKIALGDTDVTVNGKGVNRISIFSVAGHGYRVIPIESSPPEFPYLGENEKVFSEGGNGIAWDPRGEYLAYQVVVSDTVTYDSRFLVALWNIGTDEIRVLVENSLGGNISWSPHGDYLLYHSGRDGWVDPGIWQIPREGGEPMNLSAITLEGAKDHLGGVCLETG